MATPTKPRYRGFSLTSVCWGYRDIFAETLEGLFDRGVLGEDRPEVTDAFFALMRCAEEQHFDYVLKEFLAALNPATAWLLELPGIFAEVTELGREFAASKLHYGISYFRTLGEGGFGQTPQEVRRLVTYLQRLRTVDEGLALAFLAGYRELAARLRPQELEVYVQQGLRAYHQNSSTGLRFMEGTLKSSEVVIQSLTQACRLQDVQPALTKLLRALVGYEVHVGALSRLDSDELIERGSRMVCMYRWLYVPERVRYFDAQARNRDAYRLMAVVAAGMLALDSFPRVHGHPAYTTCVDVVGGDTLRLNLFQIAEYVRVLRGVRRMWPGARRLLDFGVAAERAAQPPRIPADRLCFDLLAGEGVDSPGARAVLRVAGASVNAFDTASLLTPAVLDAVLRDYPGLDRVPLRTFAFLPDFLYPGQVSRPPTDHLVADLKHAARQQRAARERRPEDGAEDAHKVALPSDTSEAQESDDEAAGEGGAVACYVYDEWSQEEHDYYRDHCHVFEKRPKQRGARELPPDVVGLAARTRRAFELIRPALSKEKYLEAGDAINVDLLVRYLVARTQAPSPRIDFYEKPFKNRRDLAVMILLDVSGSTGNEVARQKTIEIEKRAALILAQGLAALDDRFAIAGFSGNGREQCEFFVFKDFEERWDRLSIARVLAAYPRSATRIGAALRHAGYRLSQVPAKTRLIILVTDGKPMDTGYDPNTRYAQYDVRMACLENRRREVHTFCISTDDNSRADMEIMFPERRFAILHDVRRLPHILPRLYVRLTV